MLRKNRYLIIGIPITRKIITLVRHFLFYERMIYSQITCYKIANYKQITGYSIKTKKPVSSVFTVKPIITENPITVLIPKTGHLTGYFLNRKPVRDFHNRTGLGSTRRHLRLHQHPL